MAPKVTFTVDTHVFRELGELLVGRDSTALLELIKNSYDADSTEVVVTAVDLSNTSGGRIVIQDNGSGMDEDQFKNGFLRIASRFKELGERRSKYFRRRYTGSKGIGRLAAHKLATLMQVDSVSGVPGKTSKNSITASIDWDGIEDKEVLTEIENEITLEETQLARPAPTGTTITLSRLRQPWTNRERLRFVTECRSIQVPEVLKGPLPTRVLPHPLLFTAPILRDVASHDPGCEIHLEGEFREGDSYWDTLIDQTNWVLEIDCKEDKGTVRYAIGPSKSTKREYPEAKRREFSHPHPAPKDGPFFQARILARDEQIRGADLLRWSRQTSGVRVYLEGFRVLPYGDAGDDWLRIDQDVGRRSWKTDELFNELVEGPDQAGDWQLSILPNGSYTGAVCLTHEDAPTLRMLVNREGFVVDRAFDALVDIVRRGIDLLTRTRAAAKAPARQRAREQKSESKQPAPPEVLPPPEVKPIETSQTSNGQPSRSIIAATNEVAETFREARQMLAAGRPPAEVAERLEQGETVMVEVISATDRMSDSAALMRVLASLGTQMAGFVHEIRGLLETAVAVHEAVGRIREMEDIPTPARRELNKVHQSLGDMRRQIERQAAFLTDITSPDARRRRSRQPLAERFNSATRLVGPAASRRGIEILNEIPEGLKTPPMFSAELTSVFTNLLTNAVKAAGIDGKIRARGEMPAGGGACILLENTGVKVDLAEAERWFRPFESTTAEVDSSLGQGMGLGLTITREMLEQYGATVRFIPPARGYNTAVEVRFPA